MRTEQFSEGKAERSSGEKVERSPEKKAERSPEGKTERSSEEKSEQSPEKKVERSPEEKTEIFTGKREKVSAGGSSCALILLASGYGKRFGGNKLLSVVGGKPLFVHAARLAAAAGAGPVIFVTRYREIADYLSGQYPEFTLVWNNHPERGISESIRLGVLRLMEEDPAAKGGCFLVCDQPLLRAESMEKLLESFRREPRCIHMCSDGEHTGNPAIFPREFFGELLSLSGDRGGKKIAAAHPEQVRKVLVETEELYDIDYKEDMGNID